MATGGRIRPTLVVEWLIYCREPIYSGDPACTALIDLVDSTALMAIARQALAELRPRKRFETDLGVTVGSTRSGKGGQYYEGRDRASGLAKLHEYLSKDRLGNYSSYHHGPPVSVGASIELAARPTAKSGTEVSMVGAHASFYGTDAEGFAADASDYLFELFVRALAHTEPLTARGSVWSTGNFHDMTYEHSIAMWDRHERDEGTIPGARYLLYLPQGAVDTLGGTAAVVEKAPVDDAVPVAHSNGNSGVALRLCRDPRAIPIDRLMAWRNYLQPVVDLPRPTALARLVAARSAPASMNTPSCPDDLLPVDFDGG